MAFVTDTFTGTNATILSAHTGETGATWTAHSTSSGDPSIDTNRLISGNAISYYYASGAPATAEYDVSADIYVVGTPTAGDMAGVLGRLSTSQQTWYMARYYEGTGKWELYETVNTVFTLLTSAAATLTVGNTYTLKLEIRDATKKMFVNGVQVGTTDTSNNITGAGKAGLMTRLSTASAGYQLDNYSAVDATATTSVKRILTLGAG